MAKESIDTSKLGENSNEQEQEIKDTQSGVDTASEPKPKPPYRSCPGCGRG